MQFLQRLIENFIKEHVKRKRLYRVVSVLACIVVFVTTYAMILPAITLDREMAAEQPGIEAEVSNDPASAGAVIDDSDTEEPEPEEPPEETVDTADPEPADGEGAGQTGEEDAGQTDENSKQGADDTEPADGNEGQGGEDAAPAADSSAQEAEDTGTSAGDDAQAGGTVEAAGTSATENSEEGRTEAIVEAAPEIELITEDTQLVFEGGDYYVYADFGMSAKLPVGVKLEAREITRETDPEVYEEYYAKTLSEMQDKYNENTTLSFARFYDIAFMYEGKEIEPAGEVKVRIEYKEALEVPEETNVDAIHFDAQKDEKPTVIESEMKTEDGVSMSGVEFTSGSFSVYGVVGSVIEKTILASDGRNYTVTVEFGSDAGIPVGTDLTVEEITQFEGASDVATVYEHYADKVGEALDLDTAIFEYARFFDISLVKDGEKIQPAEGSSVNVKIELADTSSDSLKVLHFEGEAVHSDTDGIEEQTVFDSISAPVEMENSSVSGTVTFETSAFSVYAIVEEQEPMPSKGWNKVATVDDIAQLSSEGVGFLIHHPDGYYFTNEGYVVKGTRTGILKTAETSDPDTAIEGGAVLYYFEQQTGSTNKFKVYCYGDDEEKLYIRQRGDSLSLVPGAQASVFTISDFAGNAETFNMLGSGGYYWNMQGGTNGKGFAAYTGATDINARMQLEYYTDGLDDPYDLNGKTFGIAYHDNSAVSAGLMAEEKTVSGKSRLVGFKTVMKPNVLDNNGILLVAENSDLSQWTFESVRGDRYYITTEVDGVKKYLTITNDQVTLEDQPDSEKSLIQARPGTESNSGKWRFTVGNYSLNLAGSAADGFNAATGSGATIWMNLVEKSVLNDDDFTLYTAQKVSVSDTTNVYDGQQILIYTRIWNDEKKKYEFFAVDSDGSLIPCYDTGDKIEWIGSAVNTALWEFNEYTNPDGTLSYYYDLRNTQYGDYIAPQVSGGQILSSSPIGLNMNGRRYGESLTKIVAWDDQNYAYVGLKTENGRVVACPLDEAEDFYFAVITPVDPHDHLTTAPTIDGEEYGITMKMIDFNNPIVEGRDSRQTEYFGLDSNYAGLLSTDLDENGYPNTTASTGAVRNLSGLFDDMTDVNHLFLQSIYNESGYFEYNSTANFAHLNGDGTFTVYDQLAAIGTVDRPTRTHGQFMPYNEIFEGRYAQVTNQTDVLQNPLADTDPRKGEKLYLIGQNQADYFFGMEMSASFTQTANGLDAWGHDIIFEFSGDDDFWFYVDGELVIDLGGVHSAMTASINFRTGEVKSSRGNSTLYNIFRNNYEARGIPEAEIEELLAEKFTLNESGNYIFKDYTNHDMKMFYMERGAGASNLYMRFNLAAVKPGTVVLSKELSGTENANNSTIEFPYQIYYKIKNDPGETYHLLDEKTDDKYNVTLKGTTTPVKFKEEFTPAGGTEGYEKCFFLNPGQSAVITLPEDTVDYYIVECGVKPAVYDRVTVNDEEIHGTTTQNPGREDFATSKATLEERPEVDYDNHVSDGAMRTLSFDKVLYDSDGGTQLHYPDDESLFNFRIYLGSENADPDDLPLANMYDYHVKDANGNYCRWDTPDQSFVSLGETNYDDLTEEEKKSATFTTSIYGTISKIPADHTVELRNLIVGTQYKLEERITEIPRGYTLRLLDGYQRIDEGHYINNRDVPISGTIAVDEDPKLRVSNQKGWGLTVEKIWSDKDFMESHDDIYFAVYLTEQGGGISPDPVEGTVRRFSDTDKDVYYFFGALNNDRPFSDYVIREVTVTKGPDFNVDANGKVTGYSSVTPIEEGGTLEIGGKPVGGEPREGYVYSVHYEPGEQTLHNENVRTDKVINSRPGIEIYKKDLSGDILAGAVFTLKDSEGRDVAAASYTSRAGDGLITIAYLSVGTYTLTETNAPKGFVALPEPVTITVDEENNVTVDGPQGLWELDAHPASGMTAAITVKNRPTAFRVVKVGSEEPGSDPDSVNPLEGVHFALYRQVTDVHGHKVKDYKPMTGYEDLVTNENGIVPNVTMNLPVGTYYLTETRTIEDYDILAEDLCFTIGSDGTVSIESAGHQSWLTQETDPETGNVAYLITIPNDKQHKVSFKKVDVEKPYDSALADAVFDLYRVIDGQRESTPMLSELKSGADGMLALGGSDVFRLPVGTYHLIETTAPKGYYIRKLPVIVVVTHDPAPSAVHYDDGTAISQDGRGITYSLETGVYTMLISNSTGVALPSTGGPGTRMLTILGLILVITAAAGLALRASQRGFQGRKGAD